MKDFVDTEIRITVYDQFENSKSFVFCYPTPGFDIMIECIVGAIVSNHIAAVRIVDDVLRFQDTGMVREL